jgi:hypothetical protein
MNVFPTLHGPVHVEPGGTRSSRNHAGVPETPTPDTQREDSGRPPDTQRLVTSSSTEHRATGRRTHANAQTTGLRSGSLPDAYIGAPKGDLRSDERHPRMVVDESGARYVSIGERYYAVRRDPADSTWRAIQLQDPAKPGIPVELTAAGWRPHAKTGLRGGSPNDPRVEVERRSLLSARDEIRTDIDNLAAQEREAHQLSEDLLREKDRAAAAASEARNNNEVAVLYDRLVELTNDKRLQALATLRGLRDALLVRIQTLRDVERSLALLPPPK